MNNLLTVLSQCLTSAHHSLGWKSHGVNLSAKQGVSHRHQEEKSEGRQLFLFYRQAYLHISLSLSLDSAFRASSSLGLTFLVGEAASKSGQGTHSVGFEEINELDGLGSGGGVRLLSSLVLDIASPSFLISDIRSPKLFDPLSEPESSLPVVEALARVLGKNRC